MHHKPENRRAYVDNQKCLFCEVVKMCNGPHHCVSLVEMVKKTYMERLIWGPNEGVMSPRKYLFGYRNFRWLAEEGAVLHENKLLVLPVRDRNFRWSLTESSGMCLFRI
jgi:hypothetical protein